jgi:hypothetical protein
LACLLCWVDGIQVFPVAIVSTICAERIAKLKRE